jgi:hypothetical protein
VNDYTVIPQPDPQCKEQAGQNIDISVILNMAKGMGHHDGPERPPDAPGGPFGHKPDSGKGEHGGSLAESLSGLCDQKGAEPDWKQIALQLLQAVSMMDTHTDGWESGKETPDGALSAIDDETSRILWGKQDDDNPMSSYQNANYSEHTANGLMMDNEAMSYNKAAYGDCDPDMDGDVDFDNLPAQIGPKLAPKETEAKPKETADKPDADAKPEEEKDEAKPAGHKKPPFINKPKGLR